MDYFLQRSGEEIDKVVNQVIESRWRGVSKWPGMSYEDGVRAAIDWMIGDTDDDPMEDN